MDCVIAYEAKTKKELLELCKSQGLKGYTGKSKEELVQKLRAAQEESKKTKGQFYTTRSSYILEGLPRPPPDVRCVEPFAGQGDLLAWLGDHPLVEAYDIDPKHPQVYQRDTLRDPPKYTDAWILTNPPYLARNKCADKTLFDMYETNDLYKCFLWSVLKQAPCKGGIFIIPAGFFFSPRDVDAKLRHAFFSQYRITTVRYFEETVFDDTTTTVVAFAFERLGESEAPLINQDVPWILLPAGTTQTFPTRADQDWIVGGDIYALAVPVGIKIRRHVEGLPLQSGEQQTYITLNALDSGTADGRICLTYKKDYVYPAKDCSRTYASLRIQGRTLTEEEQEDICKKFNTFLEEKRRDTWSLFLPQYRESKEYARKRIPFELAYTIVGHLVGLMKPHVPETS